MNSTTQHGASTTTIVSSALMALLGLLDHITGYELGFFVFYFIPVGYAAWFSGRLSGFMVSIMAALVWFLVDITSGHPYSSVWLGMWNAGTRLVSFFAITLAVSRVKELLASERESSAQLQAALDQVQELRGLLPICAWCKKVRNDTGYWEQIETYVSGHSKAEFSHGICPECAKKHYPEFCDDETASEPSRPQPYTIETY
jgi:hypothetical protein